VSICKAKGKEQHDAQSQNKEVATSHQAVHALQGLSKKGRLLYRSADCAGYNHARPLDLLGVPRATPETTVVGERNTAAYCKPLSGLDQLL
jgi:hypothetical protein